MQNETTEASLGQLGSKSLLAPNSQLRSTQELGKALEAIRIEKSALTGLSMCDQ